jgi:hypothetical protein
MVAVIPLRGDLLGEMTLRVTLPPLPTGIRWVNGVGYKMLEEIKIRHGDTVLYQASGEAQFMVDQATNPRLERTRADPWRTGYRSVSGETEDISLNLLQKGSPDGILRIPIRWGFGEKGYPALPVAAIRDNHLQLEFTLTSIDKLLLVNTPGDTLPSVTDLPNSLVNANVDMTIYMMELEAREELLKKPRILVVRDIQEFVFRDKNPITIPANHCVTRILISSPPVTDTSCHLWSDPNYRELTLENIYTESTKWYSTEPPDMFWRQAREIAGEYQSDIPMISVDFRKGFVNASRFQEMRLLMGELQPYRVVVESVKLCKVVNGVFNWLFVD